MMISAQTATALRIFGMAGSPLAIAELFKATLAQKAEGGPTVFDSVYTHCVLIMVTLCYYCLAKFFILSCNPTHRGAAHRKERDRGEPYVGVQAPNVATSAWLAARGDQRAAGAQGLPRLTIRNVWILVYGLGLVFFVTGYCMLGLHAVCLTSIALAMGVLAIEELVCPRVHLAAIYVSLRVACLLTGLVGLVLVSCDVLNEPVLQYARTLDFYSILFGLCLPFAAQFLMATVRDFRHYALGSILEVCEFGFPFAAFLGIFHIGVAYGQRFEITSEANNPPPFEYGTMFNESLDYYYWYHKNLSAQGMLRTDGPVILFFGLTPLLIVPSLVCYVSCVLRGSSIDPLLSLSLALCIQRVLPGGDKGGSSTLGIYGGVCCVIACMLRVFCEFQANLPLAPLNLQCESTHLPERVVRDTHARRTKEMQAEGGGGGEHEKEEEEEGDGTQSAPLIISRL